MTQARRSLDIKRHIAVDTQGLPYAIAVTAAEVTDHKGVLQALEHCRPSLGQVQSLLCDSGYIGEPFTEGVRALPCNICPINHPSVVGYILHQHTVGLNI
ncbi:Transposase DDE domain-containing protein [Nitrosomonas eutropha]|uniref:DDE family transposase n=2 Tax=Nitrosomonas eutropha TaxID=916 RepID=A0ABX5MCK6_9PROT|nr:hypothetical protein Neut_1599 [Nitrosomonas eutropha C91]PXV83567.1 DDE family transposase [Nitrosomonas eutropha]SCW99712.1 Transposase DDE domain-containing protein [Nitrosomonas eutropha]SDW29957.1 Transposase DDE domain-containing protein [Nitrosomonas eutropha]SEI59639.1 Transposase DDE domain-containing protein [Nitrosomonas eutropha]